MITVRQATSEDAPQMAALLGAIIKRGGTTALRGPVTAEDIMTWMSAAPARSSWHVASDNTGQVLGFQWAEPHENLPPEAADIASFVRIGETGRGVGQTLFATTVWRARALGYRWLNASIRGDNTSGLTYYARIGFYDWKIDDDATLWDGTVTGKVHKRFDL
ncbi:MAG: GNAT family N-acetyltransferase [Pseudomonadota bacterium]